MRYQGKVTDWKDDRGFGFITPNGGGAPVFLHISAFSSRARRPVRDDLVTYQLGEDGNKKPRAVNVAFVEQRKPRVQPRHYPIPVKRVLVLVLAGFVSWYGYQEYGRHNVHNEAQPPQDGPMALQSVISSADETHFRCDGRTQCSQMTSCGEAKYFLRNCPDVKMDGDHDGVPCEMQWCAR